ncbi:MAG: acetyl-CoA hydrolase/transferase C-terminal domain-containing protein [Dehalococcoidia bacterium]|jgi:4-hydroxybutyrate CoA-transferase
MTWKDIYKSKVCSHQEAARLVQSGDRLFTPLGLGEPSTAMMDAIADRKDELKDVDYISSLVFHPYKIFNPEYRKAFRLITGFYSILTMSQNEAGISTFVPVQSSNVGRVAEKRQKLFPRRQGIITQVTPPDEHGFVSLGLDLFYTPDIIDQADYVIGEVNPKMPWTYGDTSYHISRFDKFVETEEPLLALPLPEPSDVHIKIAKNVVSLLKNRDCLQIGIGAVPGEISKLLADSGLKDLGLHTEMAPMGTRELVEKGVVTCKFKQAHRNKIVMAFTIGDQELYDFLGNNPMVEFYSASYCNSIPLLVQEKNLVAINGSIEVDLVGTIASESIGDAMFSGTGGQLDFVIGAFWSEGGRAINILPSTAKGGTVSRIVPYLTQGARVTVPRHYAQYIVTEYGIADLTSLDERERALALIEIAHPKFRDELLKAAKKRLKF